MIMKTLSKLLDDGEIAANELCENPTKDNAQRLEQLTDDAIIELSKKINEQLKKLEK